MKFAMRWFGYADLFTLDEIKQAGATEIVTALHEVPNGDIWQRNKIKSLKGCIENLHYGKNNSGLEWNVVESVPVHEDIKTRSGNYKQYIENFKETIRNLGAEGIKVITYNFMPVLDWTRTNLMYELSDKSRTLMFDPIAIKAYDIFILNRESVIEEYSKEEIKSAGEYFSKLSDTSKTTLETNILAGLAGSEESYDRKGFNAAISKYNNISAQGLTENLIKFLEEVVPVAEEAGVKLAIHPDDPPYPLFGLPRIASTTQDIKNILGSVNSYANCLALCTGSLGVLEKNNIVGLIESYGDKIPFVHLRNIKRLEGGGFYESGCLEGSLNMFAICKALVYEEKKRHEEHKEHPEIYGRADHGLEIIDDLNRNTGNSRKKHGYTKVGRTKSLGEIRGLVKAIGSFVYY